MDTCLPSSPKKKVPCQNSSKKQTQDKRKRKQETNMERWGTGSAKGGHGGGKLVNIHVECSIRELIHFCISVHKKVKIAKRAIIRSLPCIITFTK